MNLGKFEEASHRLYGMKMCFSHYHVNSRKTKFSLYGEMTSKGFPFIGKPSNTPLQRQNKTLSLCL